jgi:hypothetical protein
MALTEYTPGTPFPGVIGRTPEESSPAWPAPKRAREGAPNVVVTTSRSARLIFLRGMGSCAESSSLAKSARSPPRAATTRGPRVSSVSGSSGWVWSCSHAARYSAKRTRFDTVRAHRC